MNEVDRLAEEFLDAQFAANPLIPSLFGLPGDHARLADHTAAGARRNRETYLDLAAKAEAVDAAAVDHEQSVTRDVVIQQAHAAVDLLDSGLVEIAVSDGLSAPMQQLLLELPVVALGDEERARGFLARLSAIGSYTDEVIERQRAAVAKGLVPADFLVEAGIAYVDRYLADPEGDPLLLEPEIEVAGFAAERDRLLASVVRPAYLRYRDFLADELRPKAMPADRPGLCWLPDGESRYAALIRAHTTTERSAQDLHDTGLELIEQLGREYREVGGRVFGTDDLGEIFTRLRTDPDLRWRDGDELLEAARAAISRAEVLAPQWFSKIPEQSCEVRAVPEAEADGGTIAYYFPPALDGSRPGTYFANIYQAHERFRHTSEAIAFHEAVPGHHFQLSTALGLTELPLLRRLADVNSYIEGWGLYAERLADEMGLYSDDVAKLGMLTQDSMRAARLVVDTGLHALGWSRQQAVDYLTANVPMAAVEIEAETDRYTANPGQALSYMVGRLEIQRMRADAERALGDRFDIRGFHDVVLGSGNLPLSVLDGVVTNWVTEQG
ncbi:Uncharacterized conserved protein, DUF885 familyt [Amycolatopsis marina]|uniref:Uncharacterized conserved protein, DUF885 familyt n=1 Tax=Amycolatopsis marina TaxID=490629 RepID=A0A1I1CPS8_9PSEU|nr:Uncharacterized conserved protein, DUF885 familyt [Amycolatopsis marina]